MQALIKAFSTDTDFQSIVSGIRSDMKEQLVAGLTGSSRQVMIASLMQELQRPLLVITHNMFSAQKITEDLVECLPENQVLLYPAQELLAAEVAVASPETLAQRIDVLTRLAAGFRGVLVTPYAGLRRLLPPKEMFAAAAMEVKLGDVLDINAFLTRLTELGYERVDRVESKGEISVRGGIIDVYPLTAEAALRIELFDDEVDSIRTFDVESQRSIDKQSAIMIPPCREIVADSKRFQRASQQAYELLQAQLEKMSDRTAKDKLLENIGYEIEQLREEQTFNGMFKYISLFYPESHTLFDYMPQDGILLLDEPARLIETAKQLEREEADWFTPLFRRDGRFLICRCLRHMKACCTALLFLCCTFPYFYARFRKPSRRTSLILCAG